MCFLSELWWLHCELKGLSMNIPWEGLCSQGSCSNVDVTLAEITTVPKESKHALSHQDSSCALIDAEIFSLWISWVHLQSYKNIFKGSLLCRQAFMVTHFKILFQLRTRKYCAERNWSGQQGSVKTS